MKFQRFVPVVLYVTMLTVQAQVARVLVRTHGTDQLQIAASSLQTNTHYAVLARTSHPSACWVGLTSILSDTNRNVITLYRASEDPSRTPRGPTPRTLPDWTFAIGPASDRDGDGLPDVHEDLICRTDPYDGDDGYSDPDADGWVNLQEMQNSTDPLHWDAQPPAPANVQVSEFAHGITKLTWSQWHAADYFLVFRSEGIIQASPEGERPTVQSSPGRTYGTNQSALSAQLRFSRTYPRRPAFARGPERVVAKIVPKPGQRDFVYVETNTPAARPRTAEYRVRAHYTPPRRAFLPSVTLQTIRHTVRRATATRNPTGYALRLDGLIPEARYLLLVRDASNPKWRAGGYFVSGTNSGRVQLSVDKKGMMAEGQAPIVMPSVKFVPTVTDPEFAAGWGEDSDGDGLPDIYEALVTETDPARGDTGQTGILDGYQDPDGDEITNLEEFRRRTDPTHPELKPATVELSRPTPTELWHSLASERLLTDIRLEPEVLIRKPGQANFVPASRAEALFGPASSAARDTRFDFDVRVVWRTPKPIPVESGYSGP